MFDHATEEGVVGTTKKGLWGTQRIQKGWGGFWVKTTGTLSAVAIKERGTPDRGGFK